MGRRPLLGSVQIRKRQRSEIKAGVQVAARPHAGRDRGGMLPGVTQTEPGPAGGTARAPAAQPSPALHAGQLLKVPHSSSSHSGADASGAGRGAPHTTPSHSGDSPPVAPCPGPHDFLPCALVGGLINRSLRRQVRSADAGGRDPGSNPACATQARTSHWTILEPPLSYL